MSLLAAGAVVLTATTAGAATITVPCANGPSALAAAITSANGTAAADVIDITGAPCTFSFTTIGFAGAAGSGNDTALPAVTQPLTIEGHGSTIERSAVAGTPNMRILYTVASQLTLNDLTIKGGKLAAGGNNVGAGVVIGATASAPAKLTLNRSTITANTGANNGGGVYGVSLGAALTLELNDSTVSSNVVTGGASNGGGVYLISGAGTGGLVVNRSVFAANQAGAAGAGIYTINIPITMDLSQVNTGISNTGAAVTAISNVGTASTFTRSSFVANSAVANNGGFQLFGGSALFENDTFALNGALSNKVGGVVLSGYQTTQGTATVSNSTFADEGPVYTTGAAPGGALATCHDFSGICGTGAPPVLHLHNTVISDTSAPAAALAPACSTALGGSIVDDGGTFEYPGSTCPAIHADPKLISGGDNLNGGTTPSFRLRPSSPAIDAGTSPCPAGDQRGKPRPAGVACDSGSYETQPPDTTATGPSGTVSSATVTFSSPAAGATFGCTVDGIGPAACTSPFSPGLSDGPHTISVRASAADPTSSNTADNVYADPTPPSFTFTLDTTNPVVAIDPVTSPTGDSTPTATFTVTDASSTTVTCAYDGATPGPCTSSTSHTPASPLDDGAHTLTVTATDTTGHTGSDTETFTVDTTGPEAQIDSAPTTVIFADATFTFSAPSDAGATFECRLDGTDADYTACTSPKAYSGFALGDHTFHVRATDGVGNTGPAATATFTYEPDTTDPVVTLDPPPPAMTDQAAFTVHYTVSEPADVTCTLDGLPQPCTATEAALSGLSDGDHELVIRAEDESGNVGEATVGFTVDTVAPVVQITSPTPDSGDNTPTVEFLVVEDHGAAVTCTLDSEIPVESCTSPFEPGTVFDGPHTIVVRAVDAAGNAAQASVSFTTSATPPNTVIDGGPTGTVNLTSASFDFHATESGSTFECRLDIGAWEPCDSGHGYTGLAEGFHLFRVRAHDADGNVDPTPAEQGWIVDTTPPAISIEDVPSPTNAAEVHISFGPADLGSATCQVDATTPVGCSPAAGFTTPPLPDGEHTVTVRAADAAGNVGQATVSFVVDTSPPDTVIGSGPTGTVHTPDASFAFASTEGGPAFVCSLDGSAFAPCTSPRSYSVATGAHTFAVAAVDAAGNVDPTPATRTWTYTKCTLLQLDVPLLGSLGKLCI